MPYSLDAVAAGRVTATLTRVYKEAGQICNLFVLCLDHAANAMFSLSCVALSLLAAPAALAVGVRRPLPPPKAAASNATYGQSTFEQLLDHSDPSLGTFSQSYWWNSEWWDGPGSPVNMPFLIERIAVMNLKQ